MQPAETFDAQWRRRQAIAIAGLVALAVYTLGVENPHSTALRQIGFYGAVAATLALAVVDRARVKLVLRQPLAWALAALAACAALSAAISPTPVYSAWEAYKEVGFLVLSAFATAMIVRRPIDATAMLWAGVAAAVLISVYDVLQYVRELRTSTDWPSADVHKHRYYADPLLWFLPAMLWCLSTVSRRTLPAIAAALALYWLLLAGTGSRAAWYGGLCAGIIWFALRFDGRRGLLAATGLALAIVAALWMLPDEIFWNRAMRGIDTSHRLQGTWRPAILLIAEQPWLGYGYGQRLFHDAYNARVAANPDWYFRTSLGPHNVFLAAWFAGGVPLIASLVAVLSTFAALVIRVARLRHRCREWCAAVIVAVCSIVGFLIVRGMFETVGFKVTGLAFGIALAAAIGCDAAAGETESAR